MNPSDGDQAYVSGERVFGPPLGTFDVEWVAREVDRLTGCGLSSAHDWVAAAWSRARSAGSVDEPGLSAAAAAAGADLPSAGAVARYVAAYCQAYDVTLED